MTLRQYLMKTEKQFPNAFLHLEGSEEAYRPQKWLEKFEATPVFSWMLEQSISLVKGSEAISLVCENGEPPKVLFRIEHTKEDKIEYGSEKRGDQFAVWIKNLVYEGLKIEDLDRFVGLGYSTFDAEINLGIAIGNELERRGQIEIAVAIVPVISYGILRYTKMNETWGFPPYIRERVLPSERKRW